MADYFLDPSAATNGDGTFATPWNTFQNASAPVRGDTIWCRRTARAAAFTDTAVGIYHHVVKTGVEVVGWPLIGDSRYNDRPVAGRAAWDGDAGQYASFTYTPEAGPSAPENATPFNLVINSAARDITLRRVQLIYAPTGSYMWTIPLIAFQRYGGTQALGQTAMVVTERCRFDVTDANVVGVLCGYSAPGSVVGAGSSWDDTSSVITLTNVTRERGPVLFAVGPGGIYAAYPYTYIVRLTGTTVTFTNNNTAYCGRIATSERNYAWANGLLAGYLRNCMLTWATAGAAQDLGCTDASLLAHTSLYAPGFTYENCTFTMAQYQGVDRGYLNLCNARYLRCTFVGLRSLQVQPNTGIVGCSVVTGGVSARALIYAPSGSGLIHLDNVSAVGATAPDVQSTLSTEVIINGYGKAGGIAPGPAGTFIANDVDMQPGYNVMTTFAGTCCTSAVSRTGGGRYSYMLRCAGTPQAKSVGVTHALAGYETINVNAPAGTNWLIVRVACAVDAEQITTTNLWVEIEYASASGRTLMTTRNAVPHGQYVGTALDPERQGWSAVNGFEPKAAVWSGLSQYTAMRLIAPLVLTSAVVVSVRVYSTLQSPVYVDPKVECA